MERELGWSRTEVTGAFSVALLASGLAAVPVGHWLDRHGARGLMTAGSILASLLLFGWARVESPGVFYLLWAGLGLTMAAVLYEPAFAVVTTWFVRHRHRALTMLTLVAGLASTVFVPLATWLLEQRGWRGAVTALAVLLAATTVPLHALVLRGHPRDVGSVPDGETSPPVAQATAPDRSVGWRTAVESRAFWGLVLVFVLGNFATVAAAVHLVPYFLERGVPAKTAAAVVGLLGAMQLPGRLLYGPLRRRLSLVPATSLVVLMQAAALAGLPWISGRPGLLAFVTAFGMASGMSTLLRASFVAEAFGPSEYGRISGIVALFTTVARAVAPVGAAVAYAALGGYRGVFVGLAVLLGGGVALALVASTGLSAPAHGQHV